MGTSLPKVTRVYHPWWDWECYKAGFFNSSPPEGVDADKAKEAYRELLTDLDAFGAAMDRVIDEWPNSCEQWLTHSTLNRVAWLGQASLCITTGIPSCFRAGFKLLTEEEQEAANSLAEDYLRDWLYRRLESEREVV